MEVEEAITFFQIMSEGAEEFGKPMAVLKYYDTALKALHEQAEREKEPQTNFQRHFGTLEEAAPYLIQYDDYYDCYRTAFDAVGYDTKKEALKASLAWLNAPAEDEE